MPRAPRLKTKPTLPISKSKPRNTRNSLKTLQAESSDEDDNGIPPEPSPKRSTSAQSNRRRTRSDPARGGFQELPPKKRQRRFMEIHADVPERKQSTEDVNDQEEQEQEPGTDDDDEDEESAPNRPDFFKILNQAILPDMDRPQPNTEVVEETQEHGHGQEDIEANEAEQQLQTEQAEMEKAQAEPGPSTSNVELSQPNRRRPRRKQSKKTPYDEVRHQAPRGGSPELGSDMPHQREPSPNREPHASTAPENPPRNDCDGSDEGEPESEPESEPEPEPEPEPEKSSLDAAEESLFVDPPQEMDEYITTDISNVFILTLVSKMKFGGWAGDKNWEGEFTAKEGESKSTWLKHHEEFLQPKKCKDLFKHLSYLRTLCREMPNAPDLEAQFEYIRRKSSTFRKSIKTIDSLVSHVCKHINDQIQLATENAPHDPNWGQNAVKTLHKKIIPMLVLVLREGFLTGGAVAVHDGKATTSEFTSSTLQLPLRIIGWLQRLYNMVMGYVHVDPPRPASDSKANAQKVNSAMNQQKQLGEYLLNMDRVLRQAIDRLAYIAMAPQREKQAAEEAAVRALSFQNAQVQKQQKERESQAEQMQLFLKSIQRMNKPEAPPRQPSSREEDLSGQRELQRQDWQTQQKERKEQIQQMQQRKSEAQDRQMQLFIGSIQRMSKPETTERQLSASDEYFEKYGGWYKWEDERLLNMIRRVEKPDVQALAPLVPGRRVKEVAQRVKDLRERMRIKYETTGIAPPLWCYQPK
ncbi:hypothetical protein EDB80DRAFT_368040 [Ilyonectria destructans]|nr:hypothetical protein EDB80DRAFT_368040 [Ilyonectria destructans]